MKTIEILDELTGLVHGNGVSRSVLSLSILKQGHVFARIDDVVDQLERSLVGTATDNEHINGWQRGWRVSDDQEIVCYAVIELELDQD